MSNPENQTPKPKWEDTSAELWAAIQTRTAAFLAAKKREGTSADSFASLAELRAYATRDAGNNAAAPMSRAFNALGLWGEKNTRKARDSVANALSRALADWLTRNKGKFTEEELADLRKWAVEDANPEALAAWLNRDGWKKVDGAEVEAALVKAARAMNEAEGWNDGMSCVLWNAGAPYYVLFYDTARADRNKTDVLKRISAKQDEGPRDAFSIALLCEDPTEVRTPPDAVTVLLGLDALKAGLQGFDWGGLSLCLNDKVDRAQDWLGRLAVGWLADRREAQAEKRKRFAGAYPIGIREKAETAAGKWTPMPRPLTVAAALGGPFSVNVDGENYTPAPGLAGPATMALRPRGVDIVPADWLGNPAQLSLALDVETPPDAVLEYLGAVVENAARTAHLAKLPNVCPKLLGLMFATAPMTGSMVKGTLGELARMLYPDWVSNHRSTRDMQGVGAAMMAVKGLRLVETEQDGTRRPYELFIVDMALTAKPDAALGWTINPWLVERMKGGKGGGFFLLNMTRWLALGIQNPRLFPLALRLASLWDKARVRNGPYDPGLLKPILADRLAWECNTLPEGAAMYATKRTDAGAAKLALTNARANMEDDLNTLKEAGLIGPWQKTKVHGQGFEVLPIPPADYAEACIRAAQNIKKQGKKQGKQKG